MEALEYGVAEVIEKLRDQIPIEQADDMLSLARAGEPGVALEKLCTQLEEFSIVISMTLCEQIRHLGTTMGLD